MSGNSTHLGMALAAAEWKVALQAGCIISAFVGGSLIGTLVSNAAERPLLTILAGELVLCMISVGLAVVDHGTLALTIIALTMGMQNVMHQNISGTDAGKGFITGALFDLGQTLAQALTKKGNLRRPCVHASSWLSFVAGVGGGALCIHGLGLVPSLALACLGLVFLIVMILTAAPHR